MTRNVARRLALLALVAGAVAATLTIVRSTGSSPYELTAVVESANGLIVGSQVRAGGVQIGEVTDITLGRDRYPHVTVQIKPDYGVRDGVTADVRIASLAGQVNRFVDLRNGTGRPLPSGTELGLRQTDQPVEVQDVLELLTPQMQREVRTLVTRADRALDDRGPDIERALRVGGTSLQEVAALLDDVSGDRERLRDLVRRASTGATQLASAQDDLSGTVTDAALLLDVAAARQAELRRSLRSAPDALEASRRLMLRVPGEVPQLRRTLRATSSATAELGALAQEAQRSATLAPATLAAATTVTGSVRRNATLLEDLFTTIAPAAEVNAKALSAMSPVLDQLRVRMPDSMSWLLLYGQLTMSYNAVGHGVRLGGTSVDPPRRFASGCQAGFLRRPFIRLPGELACEPWDTFAQSFVAGGTDPLGSINPARAASQDEDIR